MAIQMGKTLAFSAVSGMVAALAGCGGEAPPAAAPAAPAAAPAAAGSAAAPAAVEKHACKTQNSCKGKGGCKTDKNACKGMNECKGKGGCKTT